jgi:hypothetical protein
MRLIETRFNSFSQNIIPINSLGAGLLLKNSSFRNFEIIHSRVNNEDFSLEVGCFQLEYIIYVLPFAYTNGNRLVSYPEVYQNLVYYDR